MKNKIIFSLILGIFLIGILPSLNAVGEINYCCEKTVSGAWCQNAPKAECATQINPVTNQPFRMVPTSCEATSFCKLGCCYDSQEGTCMENTPEIVCNKNNGIYSRESAECDIPQCSLGCCLVGDQAAFVTQTRCKRLSAIYSLETNFRTDIGNEMECIASSTSDVMGACVFEKDYQKTCKLMAQKECKELEKTDSENISFHKDYLCSSESLGTNCGPTQKTTCVEGKDEVYFLDSCGNLANIYDATKYKDKEYWSKIYSKEESCNSASNNANSGSCGNCDYYLGSTCKIYDRSVDRARPAYGDKLCRDLSCKYEGKTYQHGETWCATNTQRENVPGSEYFRLVCYNNEVTIEPCAAFREEKCIQEEVNNFKVAACRVNRWQDCISQDNKKDCDNTNKRDCIWINSKSLRPDINFDKEFGVKDLKEFFDKYENNVPNEAYQYVCVPNYAPGFDFWNSEGDAEEICSIASTACVAKFEKGLLGGSTWKCVENCQCCVNGQDGDNKYEGCTGESYAGAKDEFCASLGDCGKKTNYIGIKGYNYNDQALTCDGGDCYWTL